MCGCERVEGVNMVWEMGMVRGGRVSGCERVGGSVGGVGWEGFTEDMWVQGQL